MRLTLPLSVARPLIFATVSARLIMGVFLDMPWLYNACLLYTTDAADD